MYYNNPILQNREVYVPQQPQPAYQPQTLIAPVQPLITQQLVHPVPNNLVPVPMQQPPQQPPPYIIYNPPQNVYHPPVQQVNECRDDFQRNFGGFNKNEEFRLVDQQRMPPTEQKQQIGNGYGQRRRFKGPDNSRKNIVRGNLQVVSTTEEDVEKKEPLVKELPKVVPDPEVRVNL